MVALAREDDLHNTSCLSRRSRAYWNRYADNRRWGSDEPDVPGRVLAQHVRHMSGVRLLDIGCGWGRYAHSFRNHGLDYLGVDFSPAMILGARRNCPRSLFGVMEAAQLALPDDAVDGIWCSCVLEHIPKSGVPSVLRELRRVLTPDGVMTLVMLSIWDESDEHAIEWIDGTRLDTSYTLLELCYLLRSCGFEPLEPLRYENHDLIFTTVRLR